MKPTAENGQLLLKFFGACALVAVVIWSISSANDRRRYQAHGVTAKHCRFEPADPKCIEARNERQP